MARMYRFTHRAIERVQEGDAEAIEHTVPAEINLANLAMFSTVLFTTEFNKMGMGDSVDVSKTCNLTEWHRRLYAGAVSPSASQQQQEEEEYLNVLTLPAKPTSQSGVIYATTHFGATETSRETFTSFLFAIHKPMLSKTIPSAAGVASSHLSPEAQELVSTLGATHIWLCGSDPEQRRHRLMTQCLSQLEKDVVAWKSSGQGSGVLTVHTIPSAFPGMVQFLLKSGFRGGDKVVGGEAEKVLYFKEL
ncbi:hypothetical protein EDD11_006606 [Mortierella claussenii]|nr:hypothetical protein EDD11_006606 [Mortierella claussenii]